MRLIEEFDDKIQAGKFSDLLTGEKIENRLMQDGDIFEVWVIHEDQLEQAEQILVHFSANPDEIDHDAVAKKAKKIRKEVIREAQDAPRYIDARTKVFNKPSFSGSGLTMLMIIVCVAISLFSEMGNNTDSLKSFFITDFLREGSTIRWYPGLKEITSGEIWRLFTPMFIHFSAMHLLFNMMWLWDLGRMIEERKGSLFLGFFMLVASVAGNLAQYYISSPAFGGMSGVVFGLLGYIWMKGKFDPASNLSLHKTTIIMMAVWFFLCFTPLFGNIANGAHTGGLVVGVVWGYLSSKLRLKRGA